MTIDSKKVRFQFLTSAAKEEIMFEYENTPDDKKTDFLSKFSKQYGYLPEEIIVSAVKSKNVLIKWWIAKNSWLQEKEADKLSKDESEVIRMAVYSNSHAFGCDGDNEILFKKTDKWGRIGLVQNPFFTISAQEILKNLFDTDGTSKIFPESERWDLISSFILSDAVQEESHTQDFSPEPGNEYFFNELWGMAAKWSDKGHRAFVFKHLGCSDKSLQTKIYSSEPEVMGRMAILEGARRGIFGNDDLFRLALTDKNDSCREIAFSKVDLSHPDLKRKLDVYLKSEDEDAIRGIAQNTFLAQQNRELASKRLSELGDYYSAYFIEKSIGNSPPDDTPRFESITKLISSATNGDDSKKIQNVSQLNEMVAMKILRVEKYQKWIIGILVFWILITFLTSK